MNITGHEPLLLNVHAIYGAIYQDGEFVQRGAVLGLSVDSSAVVTAPISGWVRLLPITETAFGLCLEIRQQPAEYSDSASLGDIVD